MAYTTEAQVRTILTADAAVDLDPYIDSAHAIVLRVCTSTLYDSDLLELIERWLSAHFYDIDHKRATTESAGGGGGGGGVSEQSVENRSNLGLNLTEYGRQALRVDVYGSLAGFENQMVKVKGPLPGGVGRATSRWLGTPLEPW